MAQAAKISFKDVSLEFPVSGLVLDRLNVNIKPGEFVTILGPSGSGKSTFLRLIAGLIDPTGGQVDVESFGRKFFRSFVFQEAHLLPWRTVLENTLLPLEIMGEGSDVSQEKARRVLDHVGFCRDLNLYPGELSGGMKMRVSLARALVGEPTLLLMDEPFSALDETTRQQLQEDLRRLWQSLGMTVVFVTHSISEALFISDRTIVISQKPAQVISDQPSQFPSERSEDLRAQVEFQREIQKLSQVFRKVRGHR